MTDKGARLKPKRAIRRFDVFAEYRKQEEQAAGSPQAPAKGYGLWVAKVVASRKYGGTTQHERRLRGEHGERADSTAQPLVDGMWHVLDDQPQTDALFDHEIVHRMGEAFYETVFAPTIREAREQQRPYEAIRDTIRKEWKPV